MVVLTALTAGGTAIPLDKVFLEPVNTGPPYTYLELDRSTLGGVRGGTVRRRSIRIALTGTWGYGADSRPGGHPRRRRDHDRADDGHAVGRVAGRGG